MSDPAGTALQRTSLYPEHRRLGAKMTPFNGWEMPLYYSSILDEHKSVRTAAGLFDVSHMGQVFVRGSGALETLNALCVSDIAQVAPGRACYTMLLQERGGILDDIIVFRVGEQDYLVVINCANRVKDVAWIQVHRRGSVEIDDRSSERAILAIQGPQAAALLQRVLQTEVNALGRFDIAPLPAFGRQAWIARTGYTGSDGFEIFAPNQAAVTLWPRILGDAGSGIQPVGLGARDTLRLEAGLRLCGTDMDETTTPLEADLGWTVAFGKASFIGKDALVAQKAAGVPRRLVGFTLEQGPVPRHGCPILVGGRELGAVTSGTFSLMLSKPIGMGYVDRTVAGAGTAIDIVVRSKSYPATIVKLPFWRMAPSSSAGSHVASGSPLQAQGPALSCQP